MPNLWFETSFKLAHFFFVLVNVNPYQIYIHNRQIAVFDLFPTDFGVLPILQECPSCKSHKSTQFIQLNTTHGPQRNLKLKKTHAHVFVCWNSLPDNSLILFMC